MKQPLMFFSDFPQTFASEREVFLLIFHLFHQQTVVFLPTMGPDLVFIRPCYQTPFQFFELSFSIKVSSQMVESPPDYGHGCMGSLLKY